MSSALHLHLDGDGVWPDLADRLDDVTHLGDGSQASIAVLEHGMASGKPSIALRIDVPPPRPQVIILEMSWATFGVAVQAIVARIGWPV